MNYPLQLSFKIMAIARQLSVMDAGGRLLFYVKQKAFKLKESITIFSDAEQTQPLFTINADRVIDFSASYQFADMRGTPLGSVKRQGMKSLWKSRYDVTCTDGTPLMIQEANPWTKVLDALLGEIPIVGMFTGYMFHPAYVVSRQDGAPIMRLEKQPAFFEGKFKIEKMAELSEGLEMCVVLSLIMVVLLERHRG